MKKWTKIVLGIGIGASLIGAGLTAAGLAGGGLSQLQSYYDNKEKHDSHFYTKTVENFDKIDIDTTVYNVVITQTNSDKPSISYTDNSKLRVSHQVTNDGTLAVKQTGDWKESTSVIHFPSLSDFLTLAKNGVVTDNHTITIAIPKKTTIHSLIAKVKVGDLQINHLTADYANIDLNAGDFELTNSYFKSGKSNLSVGDSNFQDAQLKNFTLTSNTGDIDFENGKVSDSTISLSIGDFSADNIAFENKNELSVSTGDVDITLADKNLTLQASNSLGDADISDSLKPSTSNILNIKGNTGDISIQ